MTGRGSARQAVRELERSRAERLEAGDRPGADALAVELRAIRAAEAEARARPGDDRRGGLRLERADIPGRDQILGVEGLRSVPGGAWARPVWRLDIPPTLKYLAASYAATLEQIEAGAMPAPSFARVAVDGGGSPRSPELRVLGLIERRDRARAELERVPPMSPVRAGQAGRRVAITARAMVDAVCLGDRTLCDVLARHGWPRKGDSKRAARELLVAGLQAVGQAWAGGRAEGPAGPRDVELYLAPDAAEVRKSWADVDQW